MGVPDTIQVGPFIYTVVVDEAAINKESHDGGGEHGSELIGHCDHHNLKILLRPEIPDALSAETLLHEVLHAVSDVTGLHDDLGDRKEESVVTRLSPALLDTLQRNPDLVAFLVGQSRAFLPAGAVVHYD